jgi:hypothetical protein
MDQEKALARLETLMTLVAREAGARRAAVFVPKGQSMVMVGQNIIDQAGLDLVYAGWSRHRARLTAGQTVRYGRAALWPILHLGQLVAVMYLDNAPANFPDDDARESGERLSASLAYIQVPTALGSYLACGLTYVDATAEMQKDQLAVVLQTHQGNVAAVARHFGVRRETIYWRAARAGLDVAAFRPGSRRRKATQPS